MKQITQLDNYTPADGNNPDARLKDDVYLPGDPPVLDEPGSEAVSDTVMDMLTLAYKLVRNNGDTANGVADNQTSGQIYDGLVNEIKTQAYANDFTANDLRYVVSGSGVTLRPISGGASPPYTTRHAKGVTYGGVGTSDNEYRRTEKFSFPAATFTLVSTGIWVANGLSFNTGIPWSALNRFQGAHISFSFPFGGTDYHACSSCFILVKESTSSTVEITSVQAYSQSSPSAAGFSQRYLFLTFSGTDIY